MENTIVVNWGGHHIKLVIDDHLLTHLIVSHAIEVIDSDELS